ncbi:hypothetical protein Tco_0127048 [Tanacetum coccineum]
MERVCAESISVERLRLGGKLVGRDEGRGAWRSVGIASSLVLGIIGPWGWVESCTVSPLGTNGVRGLMVIGITVVSV